MVLYTCNRWPEFRGSGRALGKSWFAYTVCSLEQTPFLCPLDIPSLKQTYTVAFIVSDVNSHNSSLFQDRDDSAETPKGPVLYSSPS